MESIGLRELNQNPSKAVARVRAGESLVVTDRGRPVLRMVPETDNRSALAELIATGAVRPPIERGMPDLVADLATQVPDLAELLISERDAERRR
ncbi:MAG: type II toxin-antitoxin system Phd/YefM family antitoxin [Sporichthyaceae bacterium]